jgi:hypothetical protein
MHGDSVWEHLELKSPQILGKWSRLICETYPADTIGFLQSEADRFVNPVGYVISQEVKAIFDELLHGMDPARLTAYLTEIIKIRAVQEFTPSQAVGITFLLKKAVREELADEIEADRSCSELLDFESRVDTLALLAFDIYMKCREKVCDIRVNEITNQRDSVLRILAIGNISETGEAG